MLKRETLQQSIENAIDDYKIVALLGPRQCGKTTMARWIAEKHKDAVFFDLEDPENPLQEERAKTVLKKYNGLVVIDEIQLQPSLFSLLRVLSDDPKNSSKFLILGSASPAIVKNVSETLAGRVALMEMNGFFVNEVSSSKMDSLWLKGGFPISFLADSERTSFHWRQNFIKTFLERDIPQLGIRIPSERLRRFWTMIAHYHGNIWNGSEIARSLGTKEPAARHYLDILSGTYVVRQLQPWHENLGKRLVKSPKVYIRDTGLLHALLGLQTFDSLLSHPKLGLSWESWCIEQIIHLTDSVNSAWFYATHGGAELDLLIIRNGKRIGFEFKYMDAPKTTKSMHHVIEDLHLEKLYIVYPGENDFPFSEKIELLPSSKISFVNEIIS